MKVLGSKWEFKVSGEEKNEEATFPNRRNWFSVLFSFNFYLNNSCVAVLLCYVGFPRPPPNRGMDEWSVVAACCRGPKW